MNSMDSVKDGRPLAGLAGAKTILLTSYRRDGTPVGTPVHLAVHRGRAFFRTFDRAGKIKRLRRDPGVLVAPCTSLGRVTGPQIRARARILSGADVQLARRALARKFPLVHGVLVPLAHRLRGYRTVHLELVEGRVP